MNFADLPGGDLLRDGLRDLAAGRATLPALLLQIAAPRLREHGLAVPLPAADAPAAELCLYARLEKEHGAGGYACYRALLGELDSLVNALDVTGLPSALKARRAHPRPKDQPTARQERPA